MSVQFGRWNFDGGPVVPEYLEKVEASLLPYAPDGRGSYANAGVSILLYALHITAESARARQPYTSSSGAILAWDGCLDNRADLISQLGGSLSVDSADVSIIAAAYERWKAESFAHLIGDWAISVWDPVHRLLILAKDPIGTRHLYYTFDNGQVTWSTILDPVVLLAGRSFELNEEYLAGCVAFYPSTQLTPYVGIHSVPPSSYIRVTERTREIRKYWDFDPGKRIRYRTDAEYEEHFRAVFQAAVRRRLRSTFPVLAELSGGMDSSSIVCMADKIIAGNAVETPRLDTVSYYADSEPNWDERPYFASVEAKRGRAGCHIDVSSQETYKIQFDPGLFAPTPSSARLTEPRRQFAEFIESNGYRVLLSGIGGDEILGGVPTPLPELRDLIAAARFRALAHQLNAWALNKRKPWLSLLFEAAFGFFPQGLAPIPNYRRPAPWLAPDFVARNRTALAGYETRLRFLGGPPSFQENLSALEGLRRQLAFFAVAPEPICEKRYPYLDVGLIEFAFAIPREQMVRPGQRRSLMRRALAGIVPDGILNRRRKAFPVRTPTMAISSEWESLTDAKQPLLTGSLGIVDTECFLKTLEKSRLGQEIAIVQVMRTLALESWLRAVKKWTAGRADIAPRDPGLQLLINGQTNL